MTKAPEWLIVVGACVFILMLGVSASGNRYPLAPFLSGLDVHRDDRSGRRETLGIFPGSRPLDYGFTQTFLRQLFSNGLQQLSAWIHTGYLARRTWITVPAWFSNLLVVVECLQAIPIFAKSLRDLSRFVLAFALTTSFLALDMALFQPRYLGLFLACCTTWLIREQKFRVVILSGASRGAPILAVLWR